MNGETAFRAEEVVAGAVGERGPVSEVAVLQALLEAAGIEIGDLAAGANLGVERARLLGAVHAVTGVQLRATIVDAPLGHCIQTWTAASAAADTALAQTGTTASQQAQFEVNWVRQRIALLAAHPGPTPKPALLAAASLATEAASTLLALERDPVGAGAQPSWAAAVSNLSLAFHLANDELNDLTQPVD